VASNKNQHFVPRCYLKPFTQNGEGLAISLLNIDQHRIVLTAPVKHQCSGDYFYGKDLSLEKALQQVEGLYANSLMRVLADRHVLTDQDRVLFRSFWLLQHLRTEAASRRTADMTNGLADVAQAPEAFRMAIREAVQLAMSTFVDALDDVSDLKVCLLRNRTELPFVVSDDPAIMTNRWHLQSDQTRGRSFGTGKAGALFFLPISPQVICVIYDGDVYSVGHKGGWADVKRMEDIQAFNEHQFLNCRANVYFSDWPGRDYLLTELDRTAPRRPLSRYRIHAAVFDKEENGYKRYKVVSAEEARAVGDALIHSETIFPVPSSWPSVIGWRPGGAVYSNGTAMGFVRRAQAQAHGVHAFRKIKIT
jgi:hypothetical protein